MAKVTLIGIDCATKPGDNGLARGHFDGQKAVIEEITRRRTQKEMEELVAGWIKDSSKPVLLALDAPLGWPQKFGRALVAHQAGQRIHKDANAIFRRVTDNCVQKNISKRPIDVGCNLIARTAVAALSFLKTLRKQTGDIPLAWKIKPLARCAAIEVYPAATLKSRGWLPLESYKKNGEGQRVRENIMDKIKDIMEFRNGTETIVTKDDHHLDAVLCVLAAADFVRGEVHKPEDEVHTPEDEEAVRKEGWIWFYKPSGEKT